MLNNSGYGGAMDTLMSILHVGTAVFIVGPMAILPMTAMRGLRAGNADQVRTLASSTFVFSLLSLLTFLFGFGAMGMAPKEYGLSFADTWIWLSIVLYVVALGISLFVVVPSMRRAAAALDSAPTDVSGQASPAVASDAAAAKSSGYGAIMGGSGVASLLLVIVVILMIWKP